MIELLQHKRLCNLAYWMAQMDEDEDHPDRIEPSFESMQNQLQRFTRPNWSGDQEDAAFDAERFKQKVGI